MSLGSIADRDHATSLTTEKEVLGEWKGKFPRISRGCNRDTRHRVRATVVGLGCGVGRRRPATEPCSWRPGATLASGLPSPMAAAQLDYIGNEIKSFEHKQIRATRRRVFLCMCLCMSRPGYRQHTRPTLLTVGFGDSMRCLAFVPGMGSKECSASREL